MANGRLMGEAVVELALLDRIVQGCFQGNVNDCPALFLKVLKILTYKYCIRYNPIRDDSLTYSRKSLLSIIYLVNPMKCINF
jgi:hypothetical protein